MRIASVLITTILAYFVLYAPQPLLPNFSRIFSVSESSAALLITATMLPLSIAPLSYGYLLESISATKLLRGSVLALAVSVAGFACANSFNLLISVRFIQGLLLPAALTSIMTYISLKTPQGKLQQFMSLYVTSTIIGGFLGRLLAGVSSTYCHWRVFFVLLAAVLLISFFMLKNLDTEEVQVHSEKPNLRTLVDIFTSAHIVFLSVICLFFVFVALLNFLPFRLGELRKNPSEVFTAFMYSGYLMGAVASLAASRIIKLFENEYKAMSAGFICYTGAILATLIKSEWVLFAALFVFCGAMFFVHTIAAAVVNKKVSHNRGLVNGLYVTCYYGGGVLGSYLPGIIYERYGWNVFVLALFLVAGLGLAITLCSLYSRGYSSSAGFTVDIPKGEVCADIKE